MPPPNWSIVARDVVAALRRRGADPHDAAEFAQVAIERAVQRDDEWTTEQATNWCVRVARNASIDEYRRSARFASMHLAVDRADVDVDVESVVLGRLELDAVVKAADRLTPVERSALGTSGHGLDRRSQVRLAVTRHRARAKLRYIVDGVAGWFASRPLARRLVDFENVGLREAATVMIVAAAVAAPSPDLEAPLRLPSIDVAYEAEVTDVVQVSSVGTVAPPQLDRSPAAASVEGDTDGDDRPSWVDPDSGERIADVPRPDAPDSYLWYLNNDAEEDDEPLVCVWNRTTQLEVCTPATWGDVRDMSPVPIGETPS